MAIDWSHLPAGVFIKICICTGPLRYKGWKFDEATGHQIHNECGKFLHLMVVGECDICETVFVIETAEKAKHRAMMLMCGECENG